MIRIKNIICVATGILLLTGVTSYFLFQNIQAQQGDRLNRIISQVEKGHTAFVNIDWAWIEMELNPYDIRTLQSRLAELKQGDSVPFPTPVLRIPIDGDGDSRWVIKQVLNLGVFNIVVPQVESGEQALNVVKSMRYPPQKSSKYPQPRGIRSYGPGRAARYWGVSGNDYMEKADLWPLNPQGELLAIMMIETKAGVDNIEDILSVPGVGGILLGPFDLGMSLGVGPPNPTMPLETEEAIQVVRRACTAQDKVICGIAGVYRTDRDKRISEGFRMIQVIGD